MKPSCLRNCGAFPCLRISVAVWAGCLFCATGALAQTNTSWLLNVGDGNWNDATKWTNGVPNGNYNATIGTIIPADVMLDTNASVVNLTVGTSATFPNNLIVAPGKTLTVTNSLGEFGGLSLSPSSVLSVGGDMLAGPACQNCTGGFGSSGSTVAVGGAVTIGPNPFGPGFFDVVLDDTHMQVGGDFSVTNLGPPMNVEGGSKVTVFGNFSNNGLGTFNLSGGTALTVYGTVSNTQLSVLNIDASSTLTTYSGFFETSVPPSVGGNSSLNVSGTLNGNATIQSGALTDDGTINGNVDMKQAGFFSGTGTINGNTTMGGTLSPGDAPGTLTINGNYEQTGTGIFDELIGTGANGLLDVNGAVTLAPGASLDIRLLNGFNPVGDSFTIMDYSSLFGEFANGSSFSADGYNWDITYGPHDAVLTAISTPESSPLLLLALGFITIGRRAHRESGREETSDS